MVYFLLGKLLSPLWQIYDIFGLIFIGANGQILKNNLTIWSHCDQKRLSLWWEEDWENQILDVNHAFLFLHGNNVNVSKQEGVALRRVSRLSFRTTNPFIISEPRLDPRNSVRRRLVLACGASRLNVKSSCCRPACLAASRQLGQQRLSCRTIHHNKLLSKCVWKRVGLCEAKQQQQQLSVCQIDAETKVCLKRNLKRERERLRESTFFSTHSLVSTVKCDRSQSFHFDGLWLPSQTDFHMAGPQSMEITFSFRCSLDYLMLRCRWWNNLLDESTHQILPRTLFLFLILGDSLCNNSKYFCCCFCFCWSAFV